MTLKYYVGYRSLWGASSVVRWVEDNGIAVGGEVRVIAGNRYEITHKEFTYMDIDTLKAKYPYTEPKSD